MVILWAGAGAGGGGGGGGGGAECSGCVLLTIAINFNRSSDEQYITSGSE